MKIVFAGYETFDLACFVRSETLQQNWNGALTLGGAMTRIKKSQM